MAVQSKLVVQHKDFMITSGYALQCGVCIQTDFHIYIISPRDFFGMSAVARKTAVIVLAEHRNYMVSHKDSPTKSWYGLLTGVCIKIDIHISIASTRDYSQRTGNTWYPTRTPWPRVVMHCILMFVSNSISTFRSHGHVIPVGWALLHFRTALLTVVCIKINIHISIAQHTVLWQRVVMHCSLVFVLKQISRFHISIICPRDLFGWALLQYKTASSSSQRNGNTR